MKKLSSLLLFFPLFTLGQNTAQLNFTYKNGTQWGRWKVMDLPTSLFTYSVPQGQLLVFYPPKYADTTKKCGLILFHPGDGEQNSLDVTQCVKNSLPRMIQAGMTPYSILPNKDTLFWVVACIHNNAGSAYRTQQAQIIPWILDKSGIRYDQKGVWVTGLSGGGSATHASIMIDTNLSKRITGAMPMANGGFDDKLPTLQNNLVWYLQHGGHVFSYIGDQDPGFNTWKSTYRPLLQKYGNPEAYHEHIIPGGQHNATTWDVPFNSRAIWDSMGIIGYAVAVPPPPPVKSIPHAILSVDSPIIEYPNSVVHLSARGSYCENGKIVSGDFYLDFGDKRVILSPSDSEGVCASGLRPGAYTFKLVVTDSLGNKDSSYTSVVLNPVVIPVCPACPVCAPQRKVISLQVQVFGVWITIPVEAAKIGYDDGSTSSAPIHGSGYTITSGQWGREKSFVALPGL